MDNPYYTIDDLPLTQEDKEKVLMYLAWQLMRVMEIADGEHWCGKSYDPLVIDGNTAHSYAFDLWDGGRHHYFENLRQLESGMLEEVAKDFQRRRWE